MDGTRVMQFTKAIEGDYTKALERNARKHLVFRALLDAWSRSCSDTGLWFKASNYLLGELWSKEITYDFDPVALVIDNLGIFQLPGLGQSGDHTCGFDTTMIAGTKYIVDPEQGDGGVQWVPINALTNPITRQDIQEQVYPGDGSGYEVPISESANPRGDLVGEYWPPVRSLVKKWLSGSAQ